MHCVYILRSLKDGGIYIGKTNNITRRLNEHQRGRVSSTKSRRPFALVDTFHRLTEKETRVLEKELKKGYQREKIKNHYSL